MNINNVIQSAFEAYQAGDMSKAEKICKKILARTPGNSDVIHLLGALYYQNGKHSLAITYFQKAVQLNPMLTQAHVNLGKVLQENGQIDEAIACYEKAIALAPHLAMAHNNLGFVLQEKGLIEEAGACYKRALDCDPGLALAHNNMGVYLEKKDAYEQAIPHFLKAIRLKPNFMEAHFNLASVLLKIGRVDDAVSVYRNIIHLNPDNTDAYMELGDIYHKKRQLESAVECLLKALKLNPGLFYISYNLGNILKDKEAFDEAIQFYQKALELNPSYAAAYNNMGNVLRIQGHMSDAIVNYRKAINVDPRYTHAYNNLGNVLKTQGQLSDAIVNYQKAIDIDPQYIHAYNNIGSALKDTGNFDEAERYFRKALQIQPDYSTAYSNTLLSMHYNNRYSPGSVFSAHIQFAEQFEKPLATHHFPHTNEPVPDRRLRIGYISPDFRRHSVAYFLEPVLSAHTHDNFEISCYSDVVVPDEMTKRFQGYSDHWEVISGQSDGEVAGLIQKHRIDILIDLSGHTAGNRLLVFAQKPAPVQASWIGYPATTGLSSLDYKIVDTYTDPPGTTEHLYSERLLRLPETFLCFLPDKDSPDIGPLPVLTTGHITFGSFNNFSKISPDVFRGWHTILKKVPAARLIMKAKSLADETVREYVMSLFRDEGITDDRVELLSWTKSPQEHLDLYNRIDIALDTFPYNGTTTTCEALWMGVPVVTLQGDIHASRVGSSLLSNVGLPKLIAGNQEEYVDISVALAHDRERLKTFRKSLRDLMARSPLTDSKGFTATLEMHYREIWRQWCETASKNAYRFR